MAPSPPSMRLAWADARAVATLVCVALLSSAMPASAASAGGYAPKLLPPRRTRFVATTNGHSSSYQPLADLFITQNASYNVASAYCSSPGLITNTTVLPQPPFCFNNWTVPIRNALPDKLQIPIIQLLGNSGPENFKTPYIFASKYVAWAQTNNFDGYLLDAEFKGDDDAFVAFIKILGAALHSANLTLGVFLYPSMDKAKYINDIAELDYWMGTWGGACKTLPDVIWGLHHWNNVSQSSRANLMEYPRDARCSGTGIEAAFSTMVEAKVQEIGFWANSAYMGESWLGAMASFIAGA